jgi:hypothetical protein
MNKTTVTASWTSLEQARSSLLVIWLVGGGAAFFVLMLQSIFGRYGNNLQAVWSWFIPTVVPTVSLMLGVLGASALSVHSAGPQVVRRFFFKSPALFLFSMSRPSH